MICQTTSAMLLAAIFLPLVAAQVAGNCYNGRLCNCKGQIDEQDYVTLKRRVDCLNQVGAQHPFSSGSQDQITRELCRMYTTGRLQGAGLIKCVYKDIGMIVNIDGVDQWDLNNMRGFFTRIFGDQFPEPEHAFVRAIILATFHVCPADPFDFSKIPFDDCWERARELISIVLRGQSNNGKTKDALEDRGSTDADLIKVSLSNEYNRKAWTEESVADLVKMSLN